MKLTHWLTLFHHYGENRIPVNQVRRLRQLRSQLRERSMGLDDLGHGWNSKVTTPGRVAGGVPAGWPDASGRRMGRAVVRVMVRGGGSAAGS
jgi:hypothetical protein